MILSWTLSRPEKMKNMTEQIALQMNCKLGGAGWAVNIPLVRKLIVVGFSFKIIIMYKLKIKYNAINYRTSNLLNDYSCYFGRK